MGLLRNQIKKEFKWSEVEANLRGKFQADEIRLDKRIVEERQCPKKGCRKFLVYRGVSNATEYRAYGVCEACDYARLFWTERSELAAAKKSFMPAAAA